MQVFVIKSVSLRFDSSKLEWMFLFLLTCCTTAFLIPCLNALEDEKEALQAAFGEAALGTSHITSFPSLPAVNPG